MLKNAIWLFSIAIMVLLLYIPSYTRMQDLKQKNADYKRQIQLLEAKNTQLKRERILLEQDPIYLEKVAREKMGLVREGEVVYKLTPAPMNKEIAGQGK